jgi:hypothetical protein
MTGNGTAIPSAHQTEPEIRDLIRRLLRWIWGITAILSAFMAATGAMTTVQIANHEIPTGKVVTILGHTKTGTRLRLDSGEEVDFPDSALYGQSNPPEIKVGDRVEKQRESFNYFLNGRQLTDTSWVVHGILFPIGLRILSGAYILIGVLFIVAYKRTPLEDGLWSEDSCQRSRWPRTRPVLIAALLLHWLLVFAALSAVLGCHLSCLFGVTNALKG